MHRAYTYKWNAPMLLMSRNAILPAIILSKYVIAWSWLKMPSSFV